MKKRTKTILIIIITFFITLFFIGLFKRGSNDKPITVCFETRKLSYNSFKKISAVPYIWFVTTFFYKFKKGKWLIPPRTSVFRTIRTVTSTQNYIAKITIIEGMRAAEVENILNANFAKTRIKIEEGSLFPDTYHCRKNDSPLTIIKMAKRNMETKLNRLMAKYGNPISKEKLIILASIVQKEADNKNDMIKAAACFVNRLKKRMQLCSCATTLYGLNKFGTTKLLLKELAIITPYNTYKRYDLPTTAICMPGLDAIEAVLIAITKQLPYLYFCHKNKTMLVAVTLKEHIKNKNSKTKLK